MFKIHPMPDPIGTELLEYALKSEPATIGHFRLMGFPHCSVRPITTVRRIVGTAVTLALPAADSTLLHHAVSLLRPGDVLVIDRLGDKHHACLGGGVAYALAKTGIAGVIVDGPCADPGELRDTGLPIWATGVSSITTRLLGVGGILNTAISCGGAVVRAGDLVIADEGGIVFLPRDEAMADIEDAIKLQAMEQQGLPLISPQRPLGELTGASNLVRAKLKA